MPGKYLRMALLVAALFFTPQLTAQPAAPPPARPKPVLDANGRIPVADFARIPFISQPHLSPDGSTLAGLLNRDGEQGIALLNLFNHKDHPVFVALPESTQAANLQWVNNDNLLLTLYALQSVESDRWTVSRLLGINRKTGKLTKIMWDVGGQNAADVIWTASDGSPKVLVAAQNSIYLNEQFWPAIWQVDIETGKRKLVQKGRSDMMNWFADSTGIVRAGEVYNDDTRKFRLGRVDKRGSQTV